MRCPRDSWPTLAQHGCHRLSASSRRSIARSAAIAPFAGGERLFVLSYSFIDASSDPEVCYTDIELCRQVQAVGEHEDPADVDVLAEGDVPERGRRYGVPLYIHCGMDWLYVGGEAWQRTDGGPDIETGAGDEVADDWPVAQQTIFGFATLVSDDLSEYSIGDDGDGEVIATYAPAHAPPPGCE